MAVSRREPLGGEFSVMNTRAGPRSLPDTTEQATARPHPRSSSEGREMQRANPNPERGRAAAGVTTVSPASDGQQERLTLTVPEIALALGISRKSRTGRCASVTSRAYASAPDPRAQ